MDVWLRCKARPLEFCDPRLFDSSTCKRLGMNARRMLREMADGRGGVPSEAAMQEALACLAQDLEEGMFAALADVLGSDVASEVKALGLPAGVASWNNCSVVERGAWSVERGASTFFST